MDLQPTRVNIPQDELRRNYVHVLLTDIPDPLWHFGLVLARDTQRAPSPKTTPPPGDPLISLQHFHCAAPGLAFDTEIYGQHLLHEIHPADWLDAWVEAQGFSVLARKRISLLSGDVGDLVVRWDADHAPFVGRVFALKAGPRLALLWFRSAQADYPRGAEAMFLSLSSFQFTDESTGPLAEKVQWVNTNIPIEWRAAVPVSWLVETDPAQAGAAGGAIPKVSGFQATLFAPTGQPGGGQPAAPAPVNMLGKLSFAVMLPEQVTDAQAAFETMRSAVRAAGGIVEAGPVTVEDAAAPYTHAWRSIAPGTINGIAAEMHARVLGHPKAWIAALAIAPQRTDAPEIWMRVKRILDVVIATLEIT